MPLIAAGLVTACAPQEEGASPHAEAAAPARVAPSPSAAQSPVEANNAFALDLYRELGRTPGNVILSPIGVRTVFALAASGADGRTADEMATTLRLKRNPAGVGEVGDLAERLVIEHPGRRLSIANALWVQSGYALKPSFVAAARDDLGATAAALDFARDRVAAARRITDWASGNTAGRIRTLLGAGDIDPDTRLALTNTVYLKADWLKPFPRQPGRRAPFHTPDGARGEVAMMGQRGLFRLLDAPTFQALELPYVGEELSMLVFLPRAATGLPALERVLQGRQLGSWIEELRASEPRWVDVLIPKLRLQERVSLVDPLSALGMPRAFSKSAEFPGITDREALRIDKAVQQTFVLVDEKGTEAAAATALTMVPVSAPPPAVPFHADRPFFFAIRDNRAGTLIFVGRIERPEWNEAAGR